ncbi:MAG: nucleotide exchange factor GrpE [Candidatus Shikimatogenerans bostrichidophilus]|nr:MAG: nucleotide exchange factor GrpE [Candidatus Shikimatogenerans bostrichidophilus]
MLKIKEKNNNKILLFKKKIKKYKNKNNILKDKYIRILAEFDNYKKRNDKEKKNLFKIYNYKIINDILPILDDLDRFIKEENIKSNNGIFLIYKKFKKILKNNGLKEIKVKIGDNFNLDYHEAILQKKKDKKMKNKIVKILEKGYFIYDRILRCTKVIVGK